MPIFEAEEDFGGVGEHFGGLVESPEFTVEGAEASKRRCFGVFVGDLPCGVQGEMVSTGPRLPIRAPIEHCRERLDQPPRLFPEFQVVRQLDGGHKIDLFGGEPAPRVGSFRAGQRWRFARIILAGVGVKLGGGDLHGAGVLADEPFRGFSASVGGVERGRAFAGEVSDEVM